MIGENYRRVLSNIAGAVECRRNSGLETEPVTLVAVTKNHDVEAMRQCIDAGAAVVGENRVQEARGKFETLERSVSWHLIGHLQTNKVNPAVAMFDLIHSVDSEHLLLAIDAAAGKIGKVQDVLIQVNLAREPQKYGVAEEELTPVLKKADQLPNVRLRGLMLIAPNYEDAEETRPLFHRMRELYRKVQAMDLPASDIVYLSMGMTNDYVIAVEEGANLVRVGTGIFGPRQY